jgi:acetyltransferase-like isoleucine patch superfamily enzyme
MNFLSITAGGSGAPVNWEEEVKSIFGLIYTNLDQRFPVMGRLTRCISPHKPFNKVKRVICGKQNVILWGNSILSSVFFDIKGDRNHIEIQDGCSLNHVTFHIRGDDHRIEIGKGCRFNGGGSLWFEDSNCSLIVGQNTTFEDVHIAVTEPGSQVRIGEDCMFAYDIDIRTGDSHPIIDLTSGARVNSAEDVFIGKHVWVAAHAVLLKGVSILDDSVVATGSVVTKSYGESGVVIAGNPAEIVKRQIKWVRR